jgi:hypothetical protein
MFQNYFIDNGKKYYTGTIIVVENNGSPKEASFVCYYIEKQWYVYKINDCRYFVSAKEFKDRLIKITNKVDFSVNTPSEKTKNDSQIDGLPLGWMWYIFLMLISTIFNDAIGLWILISVIFFSWRSKKIKKEGAYNEW